VRYVVIHFISCGMSLDVRLLPLLLLLLLGNL
jgi:hypothetical protein